ncbi:MAG TPA: acetylornithine transaminase [Acidothermaceae bacterium]|nr:acetylornithine transaminase [Acidothermaceae bacterium]
MTHVSNADLLARFDAVMMPTYAPPLPLVRGEGCTVWDADGRAYLDLIAGIAVSSLGHAHPAVVDAVSKQVATIAHTSNLFCNEPAVMLAERLLGLLGSDGRVFFTNSGTEANEAAFKLVRKYAGPERSYVVAAEKSFHGRTMGSLALTGKAAIREPFGPFGAEVVFVPYGDVEALTHAVTNKTAALFLEPMLGEGGVVPAPAGYLRAAREICTATGAVFVLDEIQSGIGRTGAWFLHQSEGIVPDVITLAKGLAAGLPIGACIGLGSFGDVFAKSDHGSTFGGNPVAAAAALAVINTIDADDLLGHVAKVGHHLLEGLATVEHPALVGVRGRGLWLGLALSGNTAPTVEKAARDAGFLVNAVQPDAIRIAPPLLLSLGEADRFVTALPGILEGSAL